MAGTPPGGKILLHHENPICHRPTLSLKKRIDSLLDNRIRAPHDDISLAAILKSEQMRATIKKDSPQVIKTYLEEKRGVSLDSIGAQKMRRLRDHTTASAFARFD